MMNETVQRDFASGKRLSCQGVGLSMTPVSSAVRKRLSASPVIQTSVLASCPPSNSAETDVSAGRFHGNREKLGGVIMFRKRLEGNFVFQDFASLERIPGRLIPEKLTKL